MSFIPNAELVTKAWLLAAVPGLSSNVATTLPDFPWPNNEFIHIVRVGGSPAIDLPQFQPVMSINCYAGKAGSTKPPWGQANELAMRVVMATYAAHYAGHASVSLAMPTGYSAARVQSVYPVSEVNKTPSDPSQYALYTVDLQLVWIPSDLVVAAP